MTSGSSPIPEVLLGGRDDDAMTAEERAMRERTREQAGGITSFATDADVTVAAFAIAGRLFVAGLLSGSARELPVAGPVFDPRPDPLAQRVAYVSGRLLCIGELDGRWRVLAGGDPDEPETVSWGSADFVAAEEMDRYRGYWWNPEGTALAVTRVDTAPGAALAHRRPVRSGRRARPRSPIPQAGTANPDVSLHLVHLDGTVVDVEWDRAEYPYLADVQWSDGGLIVTVQRRDQRRVEVRTVSEATGRHRAAPRRHRRRLGRARARRAAAGARRRRSSRAPTATAPAGCSSTAPRSRRRSCRCAPWPPSTSRASCSSPTRSTTPPCCTCGDARRTASWRRSPTSQASTPSPPAGGTVVVRTTTLDEPGAQWATSTGSS